MVTQPTTARPPAVLLDTVIWRRLAANPTYLAKIRQLRRLNREKRIHLAVPEVVKVEFERRVPEIEAVWKKAVEKFAEIPRTLQEHLGGADDLRRVQATIDEKVALLTARGSENLREVQGIVLESTCCAMTPESLAEAARRSMAGRPPAKSKPSVGDSLIWLCVLSHLSVGNVYFVTDNTADFCDANDADSLHPELLEEARLRSQSSTLSFFRGPDAVIEHFEKLDEPTIKWESASLGPDRDRPEKCSRCGAVGSFSPGHWRPSQYGGGLSWQYKCTSCDGFVDTGDYFD